MKKRRIFLLPAIIAAVVTFCACAGSPQENGAEKYYKIYFALNDHETEEQTVSREEAAGVIRGIIVGRGLGYTEYEAHGAYVENGAVRENDALVYLFVFTEREEVESVAAEAKEKLALRSVLVEEGSAEFDFISSD